MIGNNPRLFYIYTLLPHPRAPPPVQLVFPVSHENI